MTRNLSQYALIVVDPQRGFTELCPNELPVPGGVEIVSKINDLLQMPFGRIDATQDWHPINHCSFLGHRDNIYPRHCVMGTLGAEFLPGLRTERFHAIWRKGFLADMEAYAVTAQHPAFVETLKASGIVGVVVCGIATNICCFHTAKDLRLAGLDVVIAEDACAGIDVPAAGLWQDKTKAEGLALGIRYMTIDGLDGILFS